MWQQNIIALVLLVTWHSSVLTAKTRCEVFYINCELVHNLGASLLLLFSWKKNAFFILNCGLIPCLLHGCTSWRWSSFRITMTSQPTALLRSWLMIQLCCSWRFQCTLAETRFLDLSLLCKLLTMVSAGSRMHSQERDITFMTFCNSYSSWDVISLNDSYYILWISSSDFSVHSTPLSKSTAAQQLLATRWNCFFALSAGKCCSRSLLFSSEFFCIYVLGM